MKANVVYPTRIGTVRTGPVKVFEIPGMEGVWLQHDAGEGAQVKGVDALIELAEAESAGAEALEEFFWRMF